MSQEQTLFVFTLGPVQSFIAASRKLEDVWSGSFLLTMLANHAIHELINAAGKEKVQMIFPSHFSPDPLQIGRHPVASLPNRFLCVVKNATPPEVATWAKHVESAVREKIREMIDFSFQDVFGHDRSSFAYMRNLAQQQVEEQIELFWAVEPIVDDVPFEDTRRRLEQKVNALKRKRSLPTLKQQGMVCSVCGQHEALHTNPHEVGHPIWTLKKDLSDTWKKRLESYKKDRIQEREHLCGVCLLKRTGRGYVSKALGIDVPPYETVDQIGENDQYYGILLMDGDNMGQWLTGYQDLSPDSANTQDVIQHLQKISNRLATFSRKTVPEIVDQHKGVLLYAGGDDVLVMAPVDQILSIAQKLRDAFASEETGLHPQATASGGLVIAHHKAPLQKLLSHVRKLEQQAKTYQGERKDALGLAVLPRSGEMREMVMPWKVAVQQEGHPTIEPVLLFEELAEQIGTTLSSTFLYAFKEAFFPLYGGASLMAHGQKQSDIQLPFQARVLEMFRLLKRALLVEVSQQELFAFANRLIGFQEELRSVFAFVQFLEAARFRSQLIQRRKGEA